MTTVTITEAIKLQQEGKANLYRTNVREELDGSITFNINVEFLNDGDELGSTGAK